MGDHGAMGHIPIVGFGNDVNYSRCYMMRCVSEDGPT